MNKKNIVFLFLFFFLLFFSVWIIFSGKELNHNGSSTSINSFEDCVNAGYAVLESYPEQCMTPNGETFTKEYSDNENEKNDLIVVDYPVSGDTIQSPITITGKARGSWFFEGDFPIRIYDDNGNELGIAIAVAEGEWMTEDFVPFSAKLEFENAETLKGVIILEKDNPSGMSEYDDSLEISVKFDQNVNSNKEISLYYYNSSLDKDENGNIMCSEDGMVAVKRYIEDGDILENINNTIDMLLLGELVEEEIDNGITTEFPLPGFYLGKDETILDKSGNLTLFFYDPYNESVGGSCRVSVLKNQIIKTVEQFDEVQTVTILPEELFQP